MIANFFSWLWDWTKRIFGRSKIIFANIMAGIAEVWVMLYDPISMFNWQEHVDKEDVALAIGIAIAAINVVLRNWYSGGKTSFQPLSPPEPKFIDEESNERSVKAE